LVEIVLALGLISFALVGIFGLLSVATVSSSNSDRDTLVVSMTSQVLSDLRAVPFDSLWLEEPRTRPTPPTLPEVHEGPPKDSVYYFDGEGRFLSQSQTAIPPEAVYKCRVQKREDRWDGTPPVGTADRAFLAPSIGYKLAATEDQKRRGQQEVNLLNLQLLFTWPARGKPGQTLTTNAKIARY
jgi:hypothetical protein